MKNIILQNQFPPFSFFDFHLFPFRLKIGDDKYYAVFEAARLHFIS